LYKANGTQNKPERINLTTQNSVHPAKCKETTLVFRVSMETLEISSHCKLGFKPGGKLSGLHNLQARM